MHHFSIQIIIIITTMTNLLPKNLLFGNAALGRVRLLNCNAIRTEYGNCHNDAWFAIF